MVRWIFNTVYLLVLVILSPTIAWIAWRTGKYREGHREKLFGRVPPRQSNRYGVWLHAVSVGEVNLLATTLRELRSLHPEWELVISTTTKTGYDLALKKYGAEHVVFYCPLDFSWAVARAMHRIRPNLLILAELELWPNLIAAAKRSGVKVAIINGRLSDKSFRGYSRVKPLIAQVLRNVDLIATQDFATAERFQSLGARESVLSVTGSLKYDGAQTDRSNSRTRELRSLAGFAASEIVWLCGSTQAPEEDFAIEAYKQLSPNYPNLRLVIVPRHPERFDEVARALTRSGIEFRRRSEILRPLSTSPRILLVDCIGELSAWWGAAHIGFVGGSFGDRGGQNMIEPAAYGVATSFGPNTWNFRDIVSALRAAEGAVQLSEPTQLQAFVRECLADEAYRRKIGEQGRRFVQTQLGATTRTVELLEKLANCEARSHRAA